MLTKIGLENFKSWQKLEIDLAPITILFGTNSSGKTSVLQALLLLKQTVNSFDRKQHINFGGGERDYVDFGSYQDLVYGHDDLNKQIKVLLDWNLETQGRTIQYEINWQEINDEIVISRLRYQTPQNWIKKIDVSFPHKILIYPIENYQDRQYEITFHLGNNEEKRLQPTNVESCYMIKPIPLESTSSAVVASVFLGNFVREFELLITKINYLGPLRQHPERYYQWTGSVPGLIEPDGGNTIQTLIASEKQQNDVLQNVAKWVVKLGLVDDLKLATPNDRFYEPKIVIDEMESALVDVGFGVSQVLPVITMLLSAPEGSIILLEQPELHLHPNAQMVLADLMLYVAEERNLQLIVESHSEHLLRRLQRRIAEVEQDFANPDNIKMYFCESGKDGSTIRDVEVDEYGQIANWPPNFFGDISGDLDAMTQAALNRRRRELSGD